MQIFTKDRSGKISLFCEIQKNRKTDEWDYRKFLSNYLVFYVTLNNIYITEEEMLASYFNPKSFETTYEKNHESIMMLNKKLRNSSFPSGKKYKRVKGVIMIDNQI